MWTNITGKGFAFGVASSRARLRRKAGVFAAFVFSLFLGGSTAPAAKLELRITVVNPLPKTREVSVRSSLPAGVTSNDVITTDGLKIGYDVKNDSYYVYDEVTVGPKGSEDGTRSFTVEINDIWVIPTAELDELGEQTEQLVGKLHGLPEEEDAKAWQEEVRKNLDLIAQNQEQNTITRVDPQRHIRAYEANRKLLEKVRRDVGWLENLVLSTGQDPGALVGEVKTAEPSREVQLNPEEYGSAIVQFTVKNTSLTETREIDLERDLPPEVKTYDVLDSDGLEIGKDPDTGLAYVRTNGISLAPGEERSFEVRIRDKWNINQPRINSLRTRATSLLERVSAQEKYESVEDVLEGVLTQLSAIASDAGPGTVNEQYVAFYRNQASRLDALEKKILRLESALQPMLQTSKFGFKVKAPSMKTTWLIIYIILGFLALMSLLFFLRWFGRTKGDTIDRIGPPSESGGGGSGESEQS